MSSFDNEYSHRGIAAAAYEYTDGRTERRTASSTPPKAKPLNKSGTIGGVPIPEGVEIKSYTRASTHLRDRYIAHLSACFSNGQLDQAQFDVRQRLAAEAATDAELRVLIDDLPALTEEAAETTYKSLRELISGWFSAFFGSPVKFFADARARLVLGIACICASIALAAIPPSVTWSSPDPSGLAIGTGLFFLMTGVVCGGFSIWLTVTAVDDLT